jgi:hypothetical protein
MARRFAFIVLAVGALVRAARGDKIDDLTRALMQDPSYKVRVQAALVLGKLNDRRSVDSLIQALRDENESVRGVAATSLGRIGDKRAANALLAATNDSSEFVRGQARKSLDLLSSEEAAIAAPGPRAGAKFYLTVGFANGKTNAEYTRLVREALARELQKLPSVTLSVGGEATAQTLSARHLRGYIVDGNIQRLSSSQSGGMAQIDCDLKAFVATYPDKSIKMMTTEGASLQTGGGPSAESAKRDCLAAAVEAVREDVGKYLSTQ